MNFDIIVVGGGHAGIEASIVASKMGKKTLLITHLIEKIGSISCNPAVGGLAKGHLVKEIDAMGGVIGTITDRVALQYKVLNASKGPAVRGTRAQIDMDKYPVVARSLCLNQENLTVIQEDVDKIIVKNGRAIGISTTLGLDYMAKKIIITTGTFLNGLIHVGSVSLEAGRFGESASKGIVSSLSSEGVVFNRLKTGTCPRVKSDSIDFSKLKIEYGDNEPIRFSFKSEKSILKDSLPCYMAYTNKNTHKIVRDNFDKVPLFNGQISGVGPRYCPSIEDKISRFSEKDRHHLFIEPQNSRADEYYINGLSTSYGPEIQEKILRSIEGFSNAQISRYGYAVEYDYINPIALHHTLELKSINSLYSAGQINGTTGYEEAAVQGFMASINAVLSLNEEEPFILKRNEAYIGVLIDDLVTKGTNEPYRMFTSRAEYRLFLRESSAIYRLSKYGKKYGLIEPSYYSNIVSDSDKIKFGVEYLSNNYITNSYKNLKLLESLGEERINDKTPLITLVARHTFNIDKLKKLDPYFIKFSDEVNFEILTEAKYSSYMKKQEGDLIKMNKNIALKIPKDYDFASISGLSNEVVEKLTIFRPNTFHDALKISGITPAAVEILQISLLIDRKKRVEEV